MFLILKLLKKKRSYENRSTPTNYSKLDHRGNFPSSSPFQMGLTSNQMASLGNILPTSKEIKPLESSTKPVVSSSATESTKTQSFDNFESELKRTWNDKGLSSSINDDEIETVNEVLGMEERNGKVYYKVNFTGHPSDYTAWVCEEDLIPE